MACEFPSGDASCNNVQTVVLRLLTYFFYVWSIHRHTRPPQNEDPRYALVMTSVEADARGLTDCSAAL